VVQKYSRFLWSMILSTVGSRLHVMSPGLEGLEYGQESRVVGVVVEFCMRKSACIECHRGEFRHRRFEGRSQ